MTVVLCGRLTDAIGSYLGIDAEHRSIVRLRNRLGLMHTNAARSIDRSRAIIANLVVGEDPCIAAGEVELLQPVSVG